MSTQTLVIVVIAALILLFVVAKFIKSCLPKIIIGVIILGLLGYFAYTYLIK